MSAAVESLTVAGLVEKTAARDDHRATDLSVTARGRHVLDLAEREMGAVLADLCRRAGDASLPGALGALGIALDRRHEDLRARRRGREPHGTVTP